MVELICIINNSRLIPGAPECGSMQQWPIYYYKNSSDMLRLLPSGVLRHYLYHIIPGEEEIIGIDVMGGKEMIYHDYLPGKYCMEKVRKRINIIYNF